MSKLELFIKQILFEKQTLKIGRSYIVGLLSFSVDPKYDLPDGTKVIPHHTKDSLIIPIFRKESGAVVGSGGLQSNIPDMLNWLLMNLNEGTFHNEVILKETYFKFLITPSSNIKIRDIEVGLNRIGLGYETGTINGTVIYGHGGTTRDGFRNYTYIFPEKKAAIVIVGNIVSEAIDDIYFKMITFLLDETR